MSQTLNAENKKLQRVIDELQSRPESAKLVGAALIAVEAGDDDGPIRAAIQPDTNTGGYILIMVKHFWTGQLQ